MANTNSNGKTLGILAGIAVVAAGAIGLGVFVTSNLGKTSYEISEEEATKKMERMLRNVNVTSTTPRKATVDFTGTDLANSLPEISEYPLTVVGDGQVNIEIIASPEKAGSGTDGWLNEAAKAFNSQRNRTSSGQTMSVSVRNISSGMASDYIVSGKYLPDAYTPSNSMWGAMAESKGAELSTEFGTDRLVGNVAGILLADDMIKTLTADYGDITIETITEATMDGKVSMGYTYPYTSSTGLNFLVSSLYSFDSSDPLSASAVSSFQKFQANVPFVCYTTQQMRTAMSSGSLNACIMEYQTYSNDSSLQKKYKFIPFGVRHDNPLYEVGNIGLEKEEVLQTFTSYCLSDSEQKAASKYGFNQMNEYSANEPEFDAVTLLNAQQLWKEEKDSGKPVVAVFVADVSGSMSGDPLNRLKTSLISASQYINSNNYIGLVSYSSDVTVNLPIAQFDLDQRSYFTGAVQDLTASGSTCTYDAVLQGIKMLREAQETVPDAKLMLFVLSDGETNVGASLRDISGVVGSLNIPVYTIGYNADLSELGTLSEINEAATIDADSEDVVYKLSALFNAQM
ncbi:MAG: VWA domain-containing protein [Oscillospiraceae bacterium]|nr:VWA domain-containing protein [Oscillospiraceae bacterium]